MKVEFIESENKIEAPSIMRDSNGVVSLITLGLTDGTYYATRIDTLETYPIHENAINIDYEPVPTNSKLILTN